MTKPRLHLTLLGGFHARREPGAAVVLPTRKTQALLAYLAVPLGHAHARETLATLLWGDMPEAQARGNLRQALSRIRRAAVPGLVLEAQSVALDPAVVDADVTTFERLVAAGGPDALAQAAVLYQGDLLTGLIVTETGFDDWLTSERERLHELAIDALRRLLTHQDETGVSEAAVQTALRLLALDPLQEPVHRAVMRLHARLGRRAAALRQYQLCVHLLQRELAAEPEPETKQLYQEILRQRPSAPDAAPGPRPEHAAPAPVAFRSRPLPGPAGETPLVGRAEELARIEARLDDAVAGRGHTIAIIGEAGIGKSRLLTEVAAAAGRRAMTVLIGHSYESEQILPFGPWVDTLRATRVAENAAIFDTLSAAARAELGRLLPELGDRSAPAAPTPEPEPSRIFTALTQVIRTLAAGRPLLLILEDLHWADEVSLRLVAFLTRRLHDAPVLLAVSARSDGLADAPALRRTLDQLWQERRITRLELEPLSQATTLILAGLVEQSLPARHALARLGAEVWRASEGNPFMVVETMRALAQGTPPESGPLPLPARVRAVIAGRLERLEEPDRRLASVAAVIGRTFSFRLLQRATGLDDEAAATGVESLVRHRVLHGVGDFFDFTHHRIREVAYDLLLPPRRVLLHRRVAEALEVEAEHDQPSSHLVLGTHYRLGEVWEPALSHLRDAGRAAAARGAYRESVTCYEQALEMLDHLPKSDDLRAAAGDLLVDLGDALHSLGEFARAAQSYEQAEEIATALGDPARLGRVWGGMTYADVSLGQHRAGIRAGERALESAVSRGDAEHEVWARTALVRGHYVLGDYARAAELGRETIPLLVRVPLEHLFGPAAALPPVGLRGWLAVTLCAIGDFDEAVRVAGEAVALAEGQDRPRERAWAYNCLGRAFLERGDLAPAIEWYERTIELSRDNDLRFYRVYACFLGSAYAQAGRPEDALAMAMHGIANVETMRYFLARSKFLELRSGVLLAAGRIDEAAAPATEALATARRQHERGHEAWALRQLGALARSREPDDVATAADYFGQAVALARELGMRPLEARGLLDLGLLRAETGDVAAARAALDTAIPMLDAMAMVTWRDRADAARRRLGSVMRTG